MCMLCVAMVTNDHVVIRLLNLNALIEQGYCVLDMAVCAIQSYHFLFVLDTLY